MPMTILILTVRLTIASRFDTSQYNCNFHLPFLLRTTTKSDVQHCPEQYGKGITYVMLSKVSYVLDNLFFDERAR